MITNAMSPGRTVANRNDAKPVATEIERLALQLRIDVNLLSYEIRWALGEERINRVTPSYERFREWSRHREGLYDFWRFANIQLGAEISQDEILDIWACIAL